MAPNCSPPNTVIGIETIESSTWETWCMIAALLIPSSVLKHHQLPLRWTPAANCSPPNTVIGIETVSLSVRSMTFSIIAALLIPSSVLKLFSAKSWRSNLKIAALLIPSSVLKQSGAYEEDEIYDYCSPPNTVIGIETRMTNPAWPRRWNCSPPNTVIGIETIQRSYWCPETATLQPS